MAAPRADGVALIGPPLWESVHGRCPLRARRWRFLFERFIGGSSRPLGPREPFIEGGPVQRISVTPFGLTLS